MFILWHDVWVSLFTCSEGNAYIHSQPVTCYVDHYLIALSETLGHTVVLPKTNYNHGIKITMAKLE